MCAKKQTTENNWRGRAEKQMVFIRISKWNIMYSLQYRVLSIGIIEFFECLTVSQVSKFGCHNIIRALAVFYIIIICFFNLFLSFDLKANIESWVTDLVLVALLWYGELKKVVFLNNRLKSILFKIFFSLSLTAGRLSTFSIQFTDIIWTEWGRGSKYGTRRP